jgi:hypothetical protein
MASNPDIRGLMGKNLWSSFSFLKHMLFHQILKDKQVKASLALDLLNAHNAEIQALNTAHNAEIQALNAKFNLMQYKAARIGCRVVLDQFAARVMSAHSINGARPDGCKNVKVTTTTEALSHLFSCAMIDDDVRNDLAAFKKISNIQDDTAQHLFKSLSGLVHFENSAVVGDSMLIPAEFSLPERHLMIALSFANFRDFKIINENGDDVTDAYEPGLRTKLSPLIRRKASKSLI